MSTIKLSPEQWSRVLEFLRSQPDLYVGQESDCKRFIEAIIWMSRSGAPWRLLPSEYGKWNSVYKRFARWCEGGIWERMHQHFIDDPDMEYLIIDSTVVRAHHSAAGAPKKTEGKHRKPSVAAEAGSARRFMSVSTDLVSIARVYRPVVARVIEPPCGPVDGLLSPLGLRVNHLLSVEQGPVG